MHFVCKYNVASSLVHTDPTITNTTVTSAVTVLESACLDSDLHDDFTLVCRAKKPAVVIPQLVVQWQHNGSVRTGNVSVSDTSGAYVVNTLNVSDVQVSDAGLYTCTASIVIPESPKVASLIGNTTVTIRGKLLLQSNVHRLYTIVIKHA